jgi:hypothetical protein
MGTNIATTTTAFNKASDKSWLGTRMGLDVMRSITLDISTFDAEHAVNGYLASGLALGKITATGKYGPYDPGTAEIQTITVNATGGTFTITAFGETTAAIAWNASAQAVQDALTLLPGIQPGDVVVSGGIGGTNPFSLLWGGQYADQDVPAVTTTPSLTGGTSTAAVATGTAGGATPATDGRQVFAGFLFEEVKVTALATDPDCGAALFWTGVVKLSKLPSFSGTGLGIGVVDEAAKALFASRIRFE